jgi:hypothetical protein
MQDSCDNCGIAVAIRAGAHRSCPSTWCMSRESWIGWTHAQLTTADNRAG